MDDASAHVRVVATYRADSGLHGEAFDLTYELRRRFATSAGEAHWRIEAALGPGEATELPVADDPGLVRFSAEVVEKVVVW